MSAAALLLLLALAPAPPSHLAERVVTMPDGHLRRVTVFRDGTVVVALREAGGEPTVIRQRLNPVELGVVAQVVRECYPDLRRFRPAREAPGNAWVELRVAPAEEEPLTLRMPLAGTPMAAAVRLGQALDGIETRLLSGPADREDLSAWTPAPGERVRLMDGRVVDVMSVGESSLGFLVAVRVVDNPVRQVFLLDELRRIAVRRVAK